jgi:hypothetical protein
MSQQYIVDPHRGAGKVSFGMTRSEVEASVGKTPEQQEPGASPVVNRDYFSDEGFFVYYDPDDKAIAVEFFDLGLLTYPPDVSLDLPYPDLVAWVRSRDPAVVIEIGDAFRSDALGIAGGPGAEEPKAESVIVYRPRYYEDSAEWL